MSGVLPDVHAPVKKKGHKDVLTFRSRGRNIDPTDVASALVVVIWCTLACDLSGKSPNRNCSLVLKEPREADYHLYRFRIDISEVYVILLSDNETKSTLRTLHGFCI